MVKEAVRVAAAEGMDDGSLEWVRTAEDTGSGSSEGVEEGTLVLGPSWSGMLVPGCSVVVLVDCGAVAISSACQGPLPEVYKTIFGMDELESTGLSRWGLRGLDHASNGRINASSSACVGAREQNYVLLVKSKTGSILVADFEEEQWSLSCKPGRPEPS